MIESHHDYTPEEPKKDENDEKNKDCDLMEGDRTKLLFFLLQNFPDSLLVSELDRISRMEQAVKLILILLS